MSPGVPSPLRSTVLLLVTGALQLALGTAGCTPTIQRRAGGEEFAGRPIPPHAYAAFLRGRLAEAQGKWDAAIEAYDEALAVDHRGDAPRIRAGAVACQRPGGSPDRLESLLSPTPSELLLRELVHCETRLGRLPDAEHWAEESLRRFPMSPRAAELLATCWEQQGRTQEAERLRRNGSLRAAGTLPPWHAAETFPRAPAWDTLSLQRRGLPRPGAAPLAPYAAELGERVSLQPRDGSAWVLWLLALDSLGNEEAVGSALTTELPTDARLEEELEPALWQLLQRRAGAGSGGPSRAARPDGARP